MIFSASIQWGSVGSSGPLFCAISATQHKQVRRGGTKPRQLSSRAEEGIEEQGAQQGAGSVTAILKQPLREGTNGGQRTNTASKGFACMGLTLAQSLALQTIPQHCQPKHRARSKQALTFAGCGPKLLLHYHHPPQKIQTKPKQNQEGTSLYCTWA